MVVTQHRRTGRFLLLIGTLAWAAACVSGGSDGGTNDGPECYANSDCPGGHECSKGVCIGYVGCSSSSSCRTNEACLDGVCRLNCTSSSDCDGEGLICGTDTQHCKPGQNPSRPQSQPQSGSGGTGSTGAGGSASHGGATGTGGAAHGGAASAASTGGAAPAGPSVAGQAAGVAGGPASAAAGMSSGAGHVGF